MFSVTSVGTGELFVLPGIQKPQDCRRFSSNAPLMAGYMRVSESVLPVFAFLGCDVDGEKTLSLVIGAQNFHYVGELKALPPTEELRPEYFGWLSLLPVYKEEEPSSDAAQAAGELHLVGERVRNADGSNRIALTIRSGAIDHARSKRGLPI